MTTERTKWWKAFLPKKKPGASKDTSAQPFDPDFDPFAQRAETQKEPSSSATTTTTTTTTNAADQSMKHQQESKKSSSLLSDDTYDDSQLDSVFNEQTCRRNMKVSRSGRYKEKRRVRSTLPIQERETEKWEDVRS